MICTVHQQIIGYAFVSGVWMTCASVATMCQLLYNLGHMYCSMNKPDVHYGYIIIVFMFTVLPLSVVEFVIYTFLNMFYILSPISLVLLLPLLHLHFLLYTQFVNGAHRCCYNV